MVFLPGAVFFAVAELVFAFAAEAPFADVADEVLLADEVLPVLFFVVDLGLVAM